MSNYYFTEKIPSKRVIIDWLSFTTSEIPIQQFGNIFQNQFVQDLLKIFKKNPDECSITTQAVNGYQQCLNIGENIKLMFASPYIKDNTGREISQLLMSGQACREFEININGDWYDLLNYLDGKGNFTRIDIAIDDFEAKEINIYDLEEMILKKKYYRSCFRKRKIEAESNYATEDLDNEITSGSYSLRLGTKGSNNLLIYDKYLERKSVNQLDYEVNLWYRYEMRIVNPKANLVVKEYLLDIIVGEYNFMKLACSILVEYLDLLKPNLNDSNKSRWKRLPAWNKFLGEVRKIDLRARMKYTPTIETLTKWSDKSLSKVAAQLYLTQGTQYNIENALAGIKKIIKQNDTKTLSKINNYLTKDGGSELSMNDLKLFIDNYERKEEKSIETYDDDFDTNLNY